MERVPSSNFPKGQEVIKGSRRRTRRKSAPFRVGYPRSRGPIRPDYRAAFASSDIVYPPSRLPPLRSGYHRGGGRGAYPVADREERGRSGWGLCSGGS